MNNSSRRRLAYGFAAAFVVAVFAAVLFGRAAPKPESSPAVETFLPRSQDTVRFVAFGDQGKSNDRQRAVGEAVAKVCEERGGCAFGLLLGDNFYPSGVNGVDDPKWKSAFEEPYEKVSFPFWAALGNHDYGGNGGGWEFWRAQAQLDYARKNPKWKMPARDYAFAAGPVDVFVIDTTELFWGRGEHQQEALQARLAASDAKWKVVAGHHPFVSNGKHGNAGRYDGLPLGLPASGAPVETFIKNEVCGKADLYLAGHDHNMQDLVSPCPTQMVVSGAGASTTKLRGDNPVHFESDESGFVLVTASESELRLEFFDSTATRLHERVITH